MQKNLDQERAERNAATEFKGAVKTEKVADAQKSDGNDGDRPEEKINLDSQVADNEGEDHFCRPEFGEMDAELRERAERVYQKLKATIKVIPLSLPERGNVVVETAVNNDVRPDSYLAADDTTGIYKDKKGVDYGAKGAGSSIQLIHEVGAPLEAIGMNLPEDYPKGGKFKWMVVDDCWELPNASTACGPLNKALFANVAGKSQIGPWEAGSRILNAALRHGNDPNITYRMGGWVDCASALATVRGGLSKKYDIKIVVRIATVHWLFGMMFDKDKTLKSRFQLAEVVDNSGTLVEICYVRCKSSHSERVAGLIPDDTIYTKITSEHLKYISCDSHKTRFENIKNIFSMGLIPGVERSRNKRAHSNFTPFPPFDKRNLAPGRLEGEYNVVIIFNPEKLIKYNLRLSMDAILVTDCILPWTTIELVYVVPPINSGRSWVLYNPDLIGRKIMGHTSPSHGKYADARPSDQDIPQSSGHLDCGWSRCPCCKSVNPKGFTACLNCRVMFTFDPITEVSKVTRRIVGNGEDAGSTPASSNPKAVAKVPIEIAAQEALRIAKLQACEDNKLEQRYLRPGDHLWEVVNANMKWRIRFDEMTDEEQQVFIASGKSRFCACEIRKAPP